MMDKLKKAFGYSDPLAQAQVDPEVYYRQLLLAQQHYQQAMQARSGMTSMAGGAGAMGSGMAAAQTAQINAYNTLTAAGLREKVRNHIANEVEKMAEEIGAPTLLHAVVLAIRTMDIPE